MEEIKPNKSVHEKNRMNMKIFKFGISRDWQNVTYMNIYTYTHIHKWVLMI